MDLASIIGTVLGVIAVVGGALLEGLHTGDIMQLTAFIIVMGGTIGAMFVSFPMQDIKRAVGMLSVIYQNVDQDYRETIDEIVRIATIARKEGVLAVEGQRESITNELFKKTIKYVVDGFEPNTVKEIIETEINLQMEEEEAAGKVWEGTGGYSPTIGIIGAVLGLIHVMKSLSNPDAIGPGIAVAFVATVYGVGFANLIFIPWGTKLKRKAVMRALGKEVVKVGVVGIQEGLNPHFLQEKLEVFLEEHLRRAEGK
jgi:chemotaxis protein MotA